MFGGTRRADLCSLRHSRYQRVAGGALQTLTRSVFRMSETDAERARIRGGSPKRFLIVAHIA
jgi:hypothetical protein